MLPAACTSVTTRPPVEAATAPPSVSPNTFTEIYQRFVSQDGNDNSDGLSWATAKASIEDAVLSLPEQASGGERRRAGDIWLGPGDYVTSETVEVSSDIRFHGAGPPVGPMSSDSTGTVIKLGHDGHCFAPRATFTNWAHNVAFENLAINGNGRKGDYDLIRLLKPGFNTEIRSVRLDAAPRHGLFIEDNAVNFFAYNIGGARCGTSFLTLTLEPSANLTTVAIFGCQIDDCGRYPIKIDNSANGNGSFSIFGLETEAGRPNQHESVVVHNPVAGDNGLAMLVDGLQAWRRGGGGDAVLKELSGAGSAAWWNWRNVAGDGYTNVYDSDKTGISHLSGSQADWLGSVGRSLSHEMRLGSIAIATGSGTPSGLQPDGSVYFRTNGEIWTKIDGTWTKAAI